MTARVVVTADLPGHPDRMLEPTYEVVRPADGVVMNVEELEASVEGASAVVTLLAHRVDASLLERAPDLQVVANVAVGIDNVDVAAATERGVVVTNTPDVLTEATADLAWALLLGVAREVPENHRRLRAGAYRIWLPGQFLGADVHGRSLGVVGFGRIGRAVARRAVGFSMRVRYHQPRRLEEAEEAALGATWASLEELLGESDFVSLHCPLRPETHHLIDGARLAQMKPGAFLINTSRGPVVDEAALAAALREGRLAGAGLDVYEREPEVHPALLACENAVLLPHVGSATRSTREAMARLAVESVLDVLEGRAPVHPVNPEACEARGLAQGRLR